MQVLITTGTVAGTQPIYLPTDKAPIPFGDPFSDVTMTAATPTVVTVPGYFPSRGDAVAFSPTNGFLTSLSGTLSTIGIVGNTTYYVTSVSGDTFSLTTQKAAAVDYPLSSITTGGNIGAIAVPLTIHLLSNQVDGTVIPFKPGNTVVAMNGGSGQLIGTNSFAAVTLFGAPDLASTLTTAAYGTVLGPNTANWNVIATVGFGTPKLVQLSYDWIVASGSTSSLILLQN
jgi:hypothetical protein